MDAGPGGGGRREAESKEAGQQSSLPLGVVADGVDSTVPVIEIGRHSGHPDPAGPRGRDLGRQPEPGEERIDRRVADG